jgi:hypothetical protein
VAEFSEIHVLDANGAIALRYLRLGPGRYYGGTTHDDYRKVFPFAYGPHVYLTTCGMLDLIASIANLGGNPAACCILQGAGARYNRTPITREMRSDVIAGILGCDEQAVRGHYDHVVMIPKETTHG